MNYICIVLLLLGWIYARDLSSWDEKLAWNSFVSVKSKTVATIFSRKPTLVTENGKNEYRIYTVGICYYVFFALALLLSCFVLFALKEVPTDYFDFGKISIKGTTLNELVTAYLSMSVFLLGLSLYMYKRFKKLGKTYAWFDLIFSVFLMVSSFAYIIFAVKNLLTLISAL